MFLKFHSSTVRSLISSKESSRRIMSLVLRIVEARRELHFPGF